ncbi:hypothetical protein ACSBR2_036896 [Camellia fascicularis]
MGQNGRPWRFGNVYVGQSSKQGNGGWQPVVRRHGGRGAGARGDGHLRENNIHSVFVDDIPESMGVSGLEKIFSNYGVVLDVYIPNKRRRSTGSRFGFIRYDCPVAADMAVSKAHGLWCDDKALKVKMAEFKEHVYNQNKAPTLQKAGVKKGNQHVRATYQGSKSYADVLRGNARQPNSAHTIKVQRGGNGWLYESAVVKLKSHLSINNFKAELQRRGYGDIIVRVGGGRQILLSFQSVVALREQLLLMKEWIQEWCESIAEWDESMELDQIETSCLTTINHTVNLECKGAIYPVRICEEQIIISQVVKDHCICQSFLRNNEASYNSEEEVENIADRGSRKEEEDADVVVQVGAEVDKGCVVDPGGRVIAQVSSNGLEEEESLREVSVVEESE